MKPVWEASIRFINTTSHQILTGYALMQQLAFEKETFAPHRDASWGRKKMSTPLDSLLSSHRAEQRKEVSCGNAMQVRAASAARRGVRERTRLAKWAPRSSLALPGSRGPGPAILDGGVPV